MQMQLKEWAQMVERCITLSLEGGGELKWTRLKVLREDKIKDALLILSISRCASLPPDALC